MTIEQIVKLTENFYNDTFVVDVLDYFQTVHEVYGNETLENMRYKVDNGIISYDTFMTYCYLWRNMTTRFSTECEAFQL